MNIAKGEVKYFVVSRKAKTKVKINPLLGRKRISGRGPDLCNIQGQVCFREHFFNFEKIQCPFCDQFPLCEKLEYEYTHTKETIQDSAEWCGELAHFHSSEFHARSITFAVLLVKLAFTATF